MADRTNRWGAFKSFDVLGSVPLPQGPVQTTVRLDFERGIATNIYVWGRDGKIVDVGARPYQSVELLPTGDKEFSSFNERSGRGMRLRFEGGAGPGALLVTTPHGVVRLVR